MKVYKDKTGKLYKVMPSIVTPPKGEPYQAYKTRTRQQEKMGWTYLPLIPARRTEEEAAADLDAMAARKGWELVE